MIHQVKASPKDVERLLSLVRLQLRLLDAAANSPGLSKPFDAIRDAVRTLYLDQDQIQAITEWVTHKPTLIDALNEFAGHDPSEKKRFIKSLEEDVDLIMAPKQARLQIAFGNESPEWQRAARTFLEYFYDQLGKEKGFDDFFFPPGDVKGAYRRWDFIDGFTDANPTLLLCAVCDSTLFRKTINDRPYTSIEHFFPKSRYPHLAIHPYNLIPICPNCNSGAKGTADPIGDDGLGLLGLLLPYQNQRGLSEQTYIYQDFRFAYSVRFTTAQN